MSRKAGTHEFVGERSIAMMIAEAHRRMAPCLERIRRPWAHVGIVESPLGRLFVALGDRGLLMIHFLDVQSSGDISSAIAALRREFDPVADNRAVRRIGTEIRGFLDGAHDALATPVDLSLVTSPFKRRVLESLRRIPVGAVISYQGLAAAAGTPDGSRAVGNTMATNPVPVYVPCHRVVRSDGSIGNYGGGTAAKIQLLRTEGFSIGADRRLGSGIVLGHRGTLIFCNPRCHSVMRADRSKIMIFAGAPSARQAGLRACKLCQPDATSSRLSA
jgi:methylated-DNA-[protein]-cysteine S-methyltransferase